MTYDALDISKYVIEEYNSCGTPITNLKLQKILYYIQGYCIRQEGAPAFDDHICNWAYGPVVLSVYYEYCKYVSDPINENYDDNTEYKKEINSNQFKRIKRYIDKIIKKTLDLSAFELVRKTHEEDPWGTTDRNEIISIEKIGEYFEDNDPLEIFE